MERGNELMRLFKDKSIKAIFDISGGDAANRILEYLDFNIIREDGEEQIKKFKESLFEGKNDLFHREYKWIKGDSMKGVVIGGNIRCFLKLAGTKFMPDPKGKILLLESLGDRRIPIVKTDKLGHHEDAGCIVIGREMEISK